MFVTGAWLRACGEAAYDVWRQDHIEAGECQKNFDGSSGMMEVEGAKTLWLRSVAEHKLRYTTLLSDGDCKTHTVLTELKPYGEGVEIDKEECVNHVSKRLGTAMRNLVKEKKKGGDILGGRGKGKLTQRVMDRLQAHYAKAIRGNSTVEDMSRAVWASYYHCSSTDASPNHNLCPKGQASWCFFNRAKARHPKKRPPRHEGNVTAPLCRLVSKYLFPIYKRLADKELLKRCLRGKTQNRNEALHGVIWSRCPKTNFASLSKVETAALVSVGEFNMGSLAAQVVMSAQGLAIGENTEKLGKRRDQNRESQINRRLETNEKDRRKKVQTAKAAETRKHIQAEGGISYAAGAY